MTTDMLDLSRRAVACKGWRWMRGMAVRSVLANGSVDPVTGVVVQIVDALPVVWWPDLNSRRVHVPQDHLLPDFADPATLGCLLDHFNPVYVYAWARGMGEFTSLEKLVAALEAQP